MSSPRPRSGPPRSLLAAGATAALGVAALLAVSCDGRGPTGPDSSTFDPALVPVGREIFRFDTFGDEQYRTGTLRMYRVVQAAVSPRAALGVGAHAAAAAGPRPVPHVAMTAHRMHHVAPSRGGAA